MLKLSIIIFSMNPHLVGAALLKLLSLGLNGQEESGRIGMFSQLQSSIMYPSGSWKNTWSTRFPSSSTTAVTYFIPMSSSLLFTSPTSLHCHHQPTVSTPNIFHSQWCKNWSCRLAAWVFWKLYLEWYVIILRIDWPWFDNGVEIIDRWVLY